MDETSKPWKIRGFVITVSVVYTVMHYKSKFRENIKFQSRSANFKAK